MPRILVPTDFTGHAEAALARAVHICTDKGGDIDLLHVDAPAGLPVAAPEPMYMSQELFDRLRVDHDTYVRRRLEELKATYRKPITPATHIRRNQPVDGIIEFATEEGVDLIVMGSHGAHATRYLLGSVAEKVSRRAPCPVLVIRAPTGAGSAPTRVSPFRRALVAVDFSYFSRPCALLAADLLSSGGEIEFVHVWRTCYASAFDLSLGPVREFAEIAERERAREVENLDRFIAELDLPVKASGYIAVGSPPMAILDRAATIDADLIVVGAHGREGIAEHIIGTSADRVLRHAEVPVLLVTGHRVAGSD